MFDQIDIIHYIITESIEKELDAFKKHTNEELAFYCGSMSEQRFLEDVAQKIGKEEKVLRVDLFLKHKKTYWV